MAKYCLVAQGRADAYVRAPLPGGQSERIWDHAAALVVERAGGRVTDFEGKRIDFSKGRG
jgi:3'(2'), 5'-bisphosphate nucleotidase